MYQQTIVITIKEKNMKVFVVIECGIDKLNGLLCTTLGVCTTIENAKTKMINNYHSFIDNHIKTLCDYNNNTIISSEVDEMLCTVIYRTFGEVERHYVFIDEVVIEF